MKKVWLMGGFGNVLFQILAFNIISKTNDNVFFVTKLTERNFITKILGWSIHQKLYNDLIDEKKTLKVNSINSLFIVFLSFISKKIKKKFFTATFYSDSIQLNLKVSENVFGYFQDSTFLKSNSKDILKLGKRINLKYSIKNNNSIVVHYRKGDSNWAIEFAYYYEEIKKLLQNEEKEILIVTDSEKAAVSFFKEINNLRVLSSTSAISDFEYLVSAKKLYCAPSTFSWWAAHSLNENAKVIAPMMLEKKLGFYINKKKYKLI